LRPFSDVSTLGYETKAVETPDPDPKRPTFTNTWPTDPDSTTACTLYRRISAHLYATLFTPDSRRASLLESAQHFALTFFPWANPLSSDTEKDEELAHIINDTVDAVLWLYGEGKNFDWLWGMDDGRVMGEVTVRPGLEVDGEKVMDPVAGY
jgi:hypothetical protein